jgi:hypothetical protein
MGHRVVKIIETEGGMVVSRAMERRMGSCLMGTEFFSSWDWLHTNMKVLDITE